MNGHDWSSVPRVKREGKSEGLRALFVRSDGVTLGVADDPPSGTVDMDGRHFKLSPNQTKSFATYEEDVPPETLKAIETELRQALDWLRSR